MQDTSAERENVHLLPFQVASHFPPGNPWPKTPRDTARASTICSSVPNVTQIPTLHKGEPDFFLAFVLKMKDSYWIKAVFRFGKLTEVGFRYVL